MKRRNREHGAPRLFAHGVTAETWAKRFGVVPFTYPCSQCGTPRTTTIPFAQGSLRGLQAPPCPCGHQFAPFAMVRDPRVGDLFSGGGRLDR